MEKKRVDSLLALQPPNSKKQLRSFIGAINWYRDFWRHRSHILSPLYELLREDVPFKWLPIHQQAYTKIKSIMAIDTLLEYPDPTQPYAIYTDASDYQLGSIIVQNEHPVAYYSKKLTPTQRNYTTQEKELLSIIMTFKEFEVILRGADITVYTDHETLTRKNLTTPRVLRWRLLIEDFAPTFIHIPGKKNLFADALSRLPVRENATISVAQMKDEQDMQFYISCCYLNQMMSDQIAEEMELEVEEDADEEVNKSVIGDTDDQLFALDLLTSYIHYPDLIGIPCPFNWQRITQFQQADQQLQLSLQQSRQHFQVREMAPGIQVIYRILDLERAQESARIALPTELVNWTVSWYHLMLGHAGITRMKKALSNHFYHPQLMRIIEGFACDACQQCKPVGPGYGELPARETALLPWEEIAVDLIGPWSITIQNREIEFNALTVIDTVTNLTELTLIDNKTADHVARKFMNTWLARYPRPMTVIHDQGGEFIGDAFQRMLTRFGIRDASTTARNPQANAVCERMHQVVASIWRIMKYCRPPTNEIEARRLIEDSLYTAMHATRVGPSSSLMNQSPGTIAFHRDMLLNIPYIADLVALQANRQRLIDEEALRSNARRRSFDVAIGDRVLLIVPGPRKLDVRKVGPFEVIQVHVNGNVTIRRNAHVVERINIRKIFPYKTRQLL